MSAKTIAAFNKYRSEHGATVFTAPHVDVYAGGSRPSLGNKRKATTVRPTAASLADGLAAEANELRRNGHAMLARAEELDAAERAARRMERSGK